MPGRLVMDGKEPQGLIGLKRDGSHLSQPSEGPEQKRIASDAFRTRLNGVPASSGVVDTPGEAPTTNGILQHEDPGTSLLPAESNATGELPELEHFEDSLVSFGKILERMSQQTYFDFSEAIEVLADIKLNPQAQLTNGLGGQASTDKSPESVDKKLRLLNLAQTHKDRFIKALVLSDWARNMDDMKRLIEVSMFLRKQDGITHAVADSLYRLKENMVGAKMPNPNIEGALQLLTTGEAPWMPGMDYIPPKPLSARELLDTLSDMDFALSVRLNLHEDLPTHFQKYSIADGRATFTVGGEFEVDLAVANDEADSPFYFIDLRLLFSPTTSINSDRLRNQLEARVNDTLAASGLQGCYDFLHNFVLTHKLNVLRCQALELARGKWCDNVDVQDVHRSVIVQYWTRQPGGKNWIELGLSRGNVKTGGKQKPIAHLTCRWFRRGQEVKEHDLSFDFTQLSMEKSLNQVIAKHASGRLAALSTDLERLALNSSSFSQSLVTSATDATDCSLRLSTQSCVTSLYTDPIRGGYYVQPQSQPNRDIEYRLNQDRLADGASVIRFNICRNQLDHVESCARAIGLARCSVTSHKGPATSILREAVIYMSFQRPSWGSNCALTVTCNLADGPAWYLATLDGPADDRAIVHLRALDNTRLLAGRVDAKVLLQIERMAIQASSVLTSDSELSSIRQAPKGSSPSWQVAKESGVAQEAEWPQFFDPNDLLMGEEASQAPSPMFETSGFCGMDVPLTDDDDEGLIYHYRTRLRTGIASRTIMLLHRSLKNDRHVQIGQKGEVQVQWRAPLGAKIYPQLRSKLLAISTLCAHVEMLSKNHCAILELGLDAISFCYAPKLTCKVLTSSRSQSPMLSFGVQPRDDAQYENPHARIRRQLERIISSDPTSDGDRPTATQLNNLVQTLQATLPLLQCGKEFEQKQPIASVTLHCHSALEYRLIYRKSLASMSLTIVGLAKNKRFNWLVKPVSSSVTNSQSRAALAALAALAAMFKTKGDGWYGGRSRAIATVGGVSNFLCEFDELIRNTANLPATDDDDETIAQPSQQVRPNQLQQGPQAIQRGNKTKPAANSRENAVVVVD